MRRVSGWASFDGHNNRPRPAAQGRAGTRWAVRRHLAGNSSQHNNSNNNLSAVSETMIPIPPRSDMTAKASSSVTSSPMYTGKTGPSASFEICSCCYGLHVARVGMSG